MHGAKGRSSYVLSGHIKAESRAANDLHPTHQHSPILTPPRSKILSPECPYHLGQSCPHRGRQSGAPFLPRVGMGFPGVMGWGSGPQSSQIQDYLGHLGYGQGREKLGEITTAESILKDPKTFPVSPNPTPTQKVLAGLRAPGQRGLESRTW